MSQSPWPESAENLTKLKFWSPKLGPHSQGPPETKLPQLTAITALQLWHPPWIHALHGSTSLVLHYGLQNTTSFLSCLSHSHSPAYLQTRKSLTVACFHVVGKFRALSLKCPSHTILLTWKTPIPTPKTNSDVISSLKPSLPLTNF